MKASMLFLALRAKGLVVDIITVDYRTFQISGSDRFQGIYERLFHADSHPTRRNVSEGEMQFALDHATEIRLWTGPSYRVITKTELETELAPFPLKKGG